MKKKCIHMSLAATIPAAAKLLAFLANFLDEEVTEISVYDDEREFPEPADVDVNPDAASIIRPLGYPD